MTYTHCRGCGVALRHPSDLVDGLCVGTDGTAEEASDGGCTGRCQEWASENGREVQRGMDRWWATPAWAVAIDEWLAATR